LNTTIKIEVYDKGEDQQDDFEGEVEIPLKDLDHQNKVEGSYNLMQKDGTLSEGEIRLKLQLIWSSKMYFKANIDKCDEHFKKIDIESAKLNDLMDRILNKPFGIIFEPEIEGILFEKLFIKEYDLSNVTKKTVFVKAKQPKSLITSITHMIRGGLSNNKIIT